MKKRRNRRSRLEPFKKRIAGLLVAGSSQEAIAREYGVSQSTINRYIARGDVKAAIQAEGNRLIQGVPDAVDNVIELVTGMKYLVNNDYRGKDLAMKASYRVLETAGLLTGGGTKLKLSLGRDEASGVSSIIARLIKLELAENLGGGVPKALELDVADG